jgi:SAM-dependent methyltransferase
MVGLLGRVGRRIVMPFGAVELASGSRGRFLDVGCGSGQMVRLASQLGWDAMGLEIDPLAVKAARKRGLNIVQGAADQLVDYEVQFDAILCSHVLEHVHDPVKMLRELKRALRPGGMLLITLPNALSALRRHFGPDWRGLEAPRHLAIPSEPELVTLLTSLGFSICSHADNRIETAAESFRIRRRSLTLNKDDMRRATQLEMEIAPLATPFSNDFVKLVCRLPGLTP